MGSLSKGKFLDPSWFYRVLEFALEDGKLVTENQVFEVILWIRLTKKLRMDKMDEISFPIINHII